MARQRKAYKREERKAMIVQALALDYQNGGEGWLTIAEIAHLLHVTPSTKLRDMVTELLIDGVVVVKTYEYPGITQYRRFYALADEYARKHGRQRTEPRSIKIRGSKQGQQFMFQEWVS